MFPTVDASRPSTIRSDSVGAVRHSHVAARISSADRILYGRVGFKPDGDSPYSYVSIVTS